MAPSKSKTKGKDAAPVEETPETTIPDTELPLPPLPIWDPADIAAENWGSLDVGGDTGGGGGKKKKGKGGDDGAVGDHFEDPSGTLPLPKELQSICSKFVRPVEFFAPQIEANVAAQQAALDAAAAAAAAAAEAAEATDGGKGKSKKAGGGDKGKKKGDDAVSDIITPVPVVISPPSPGSRATVYHDALNQTVPAEVAERKRKRQLRALANRTPSSLLSWIQSVFALVGENEAKFPDGSYLWENIYPQDPQTRLPVYNPSGKYAVRVWQDGHWRKLLIDDTIPVDDNNQALLVTGDDLTTLELWPLLLSKALLKLAHADPQLQDHAHCMMHWLTGANAHLNTPSGVDEFIRLLQTSESTGTSLVALARPPATYVDPPALPEGRPDSLTFAPMTSYLQAQACSRDSTGGYLCRLSCVAGEWKGRFSDSDRSSWDADLEEEMGVMLQDRLDSDVHDFFMSALDAHAIYPVVYVYTLQDDASYYQSYTCSWSDITKPYKQTPAPLLCTTVDSEDGTDIEVVLSTPVPRAAGSDTGTAILRLYSVDLRTGLPSAYPSLELSASRHGCQWFRVPQGRSVWSCEVECTRGYSLSVASPHLSPVFTEAPSTQDLPDVASVAAGDKKKGGGKEDKKKGTESKKPSAKDAKDKKGSGGKGGKGGDTHEVGPSPLEHENAVHACPISERSEEEKSELTTQISERETAVRAALDRLSQAEQAAAQDADGGSGSSSSSSNSGARAQLERELAHINYLKGKLAGESDITLTANTAHLDSATSVLSTRLQSHIHEVPLELPLVPAPRALDAQTVACTAAPCAWTVWFKFTFNVTAATVFQSNLRLPLEFVEGYGHRVRFSLFDNASREEYASAGLSVVPTTLFPTPAGYTLYADVRLVAPKGQLSVPPVPAVSGVLNMTSSRALQDLIYLPQLPVQSTRALYQVNRHHELFRQRVFPETASVLSLRLNATRGTLEDQEQLAAPAEASGKDGGKGKSGAKGKPAAPAGDKGKSGSKGKGGDPATTDAAAAAAAAAAGQAPPPVPLLRPDVPWLDAHLSLTLLDHDKVIARADGVNTVLLPIVACAASQSPEAAEAAAGAGGKGKKGKDLKRESSVKKDLKRESSVASKKGASKKDVTPAAAEKGGDDGGDDGGDAAAPVEHHYTLVAALNTRQWLAYGHEVPADDILGTLAWELLTSNSTPVHYSADSSAQDAERALKATWCTDNETTPEQRAALARQARNKFLVEHGMEPEQEIAISADDKKGKKGAKDDGKSKGKASKDDKGGKKKKGEPEPEPEPEVEIEPVRPRVVQVPEGTQPILVSEEWASQHAEAESKAREDFAALHRQRQEQFEAYTAKLEETKDKLIQGTADWGDKRNSQWQSAWQKREAWRQARQAEQETAAAARKAEEDALAAANKAAGKKGKK